MRVISYDRPSKRAGIAFGAALGVSLMIAAGSSQCWNTKEGLGRAPLHMLEHGVGNERVQAVLQMGDDIADYLHALHIAAECDDDVGVQARIALDRVRRHLDGH